MTPREYYLGIDPSVRSTGISVVHYNGDKPKIVYKTTVKPDNKIRGVYALALIAKVLDSVIAKYPIKFAMIEGYAHGSPHRARELGEVGGVVRFVLYKHMIDFGIISPVGAKKFMLGPDMMTKPEKPKKRGQKPARIKMLPGSTTKPMIKERLTAAYGVSFNNTDESDAALQAVIAAHVMPVTRRIVMTQYQREAIELVHRFSPKRLESELSSALSRNLGSPKVKKQPK